MNLARKIESGRKKAANKLNVKLKEIKATKGKTPTPVRLKEKFSFVNVKGKKREYVKKFAYDRALAKNKAEIASLLRMLRPSSATIAISTPTPVRLKEKFSFVNVKGKKREYVRKGMYEKALAKNKAERNKTKAKTPTPKAKWSNANNKQFMELLAREKNAQRKLANEMNKARPLKNGPLNPAVAYALNTPKNTKKINKYVNGLSNDERNVLKKKICQP